MCSEEEPRELVGGERFGGIAFDGGPCSSKQDWLIEMQKLRSCEVKTKRSVSISVGRMPTHYPQLRELLRRATAVLEGQLRAESETIYSDIIGQCLLCEDGSK